MIGDVLGSYRVVSRLGAGGMGTVWLADHQLLGSRAAIKVLLPEMSSNPKIVQRFFDEARAASRIQDPGIVRVLDFGWHEGRAFLVMEHLVGETLADRLARLYRLPPVEAVRLLQQCAIAMAAAHARGIVHRDLKPDNIFLVPDAAVVGGERIKILDFGIAKLVDDAEPGHSRTQTGVIMGTPAFMSPEQCRGAGGVDHRSDVYALGCVLFMMLCGRPPFISPTAGDMIASHLLQAPPAPSSLVPTLPPEVDALVLRCLEKPVEQRFQTMTELVRAGALISGDGLSIETIPPMLATPRPAVAEPAARVDLTSTGETVVTVPPATAVPAVNTTLGSSSGEAVPTGRPWRGGLVVVIAAASLAGALAFAMTRGPSEQRSSAPTSGSAPRLAVPPDAGVARVPADASVAIAPDASVATATPEKTTTPPPRTPPRTTPGRKPPVAPVKPPPTQGSGAAGSGSTKPYDPLSDR